MSVKPIAAGAARSHGLGQFVVVLACLAALGAVCGGPPLAVFGSATGLIGLLALVLLLAVFNPTSRRDHGWRAVGGAVARGHLLLVPFAALAGVGWLWLHWDTGQAFATAGFMAAGAATGAEMTKIGGGRFMGGLLPMMWSLLSSLAWMVLSGLLAVLIT